MLGLVGSGNKTNSCSSTCLALFLGKREGGERLGLAAPLSHCNLRVAAECEGLVPLHIRVKLPIAHSSSH